MRIEAGVFSWLCTLLGVWCMALTLDDAPPRRRWLVTLSGVFLIVGNTIWVYQLVQ